MRKLSLVAVVLLSVACKKKEESAPAAPAEKPAATAPAPAEGAPAAAAPTPAAPAAAAATVDACALMPKDKVEAILGKLDTDLMAGTPRGSDLGSCTVGSAKGAAMVGARPAGEFDATAKYAKNGHDVAGVGEKAVMTDSGMLVQVAGKPYFLQVTVMDMKTTKQDEALATALAKLAVENAK